MFKVVKESGKSNGTGEFLKSVLIEVATENYRQLMQENMSLGDIPLDPPLKASERIMSGLFANAISKVSARSRPEARIDREKECDNDPDADEVDEKKSKAGRVDFLAWHGNRTIAIELKVAGINWSDPQITIQARNRWNKVVDQATTARKALMERSREDKSRYPNIESIGLMVLVTRSPKKAEHLNKEEIVVKIQETITEIKKNLVTETNEKLIRPDFIATYTFPSEFRDFIKKRRGKENADGKISSTPFVIFMAYRAK